VTRNTSNGPNGNIYWNENILKKLTTTNWRASSVPAAAVIPTPRVYIKIVAFKTLVVENMIFFVKFFEGWFIVRR